MKKFLSGMCASVLAASFALSGAAPLHAAQIFVPANQAAGPIGQGANPDIQYVRDNWRAQGGRNGWHRGGRHNGDWNRGWAGRGPWGGRDMPYYNRGGRNWAYYNGYRGYRDYRPGYRYYNDYWFPAAAFIAGALVTGAIVNSGPRYSNGGGGSHEQWCYNRYRSYRASDNTFQPYNGPRRQCVSPY